MRWKNKSETSVMVSINEFIRVGGAVGATAPSGRRKRRNLQRKFVSAPPADHVYPRQSKSQFLEHFFLGAGDLEVGVVHLVVLDCLLRATTKKGRRRFRREKVYPRQNPGYTYE